jgi:hypothetical protein
MGFVISRLAGDNRYDYFALSNIFCETVVSTVTSYELDYQGSVPG